MYRLDTKNKHLNERRRNSNVIVAQYIGTGNLLGQLSQGNQNVYKQFIFKFVMVFSTNFQPCVGARYRLDFESF